MTMIRDAARAIDAWMAARLLFLANAVIWIILAVVTLLRVSGIGRLDLMRIIAALMIVNAGIMLWLGLTLRKGHKWRYYFAMLFLAANILLTITDEFGMLDLGTLVLDMVLLVLLIAGRRNPREPG